MFCILLNLQYIRCAMSDYGCYNVTEPPIDAPRDPMYKSEREISKVRMNLILYYNASSLLVFLKFVTTLYRYQALQS